MDGYKYQLVESYSINTGIIPDIAINTPFISLDTNGYLTIRQGYAWDGPSGPTFDTKNFMRGSLVHDALYQLMRRGYLNIDTNRNKADRLLKHICKEDGMSSLRAWWVYQGVHAFGKSAASKPRKQSTAP